MRPLVRPVCANSYHLYYLCVFVCSETIQNSYPSCSNALIKQWMRDKISITKKRVAMKNAGAMQNLISSDLRPELYNA